jgi:hypothetical protein
MGRIPPKQSAEFVHHTGDALEVHRRPHGPERPVVCLGETFARPIGEGREPLPAAPGQVGRYDRVYGRDGTASLSLAFGPLAGRRHVAVAEGRQRGDRARLVAALPEGRHAEAERLVPVTDRLDTRSPASLHEVFPPERAERPADRPEVRRTPEHGSRLDMAGIESGALARGLPERVGDRPAPGRHATARERDRHGAGVAADRRLTTADARVKPRKLYPTIDA